jgi:hypothetical protein
MAEIYLKGIKKGVEKEDIEQIKLELQKVRQEKSHDSTLLAEVTSRLAKMEQLVGGKLAKTIHMLDDIPDNIYNVDDWFKKLLTGELKPQFTNLPNPKKS